VRQSTDEDVGGVDGEVPTPDRGREQRGATLDEGLRMSGRTLRKGGSA
jgi:hypothetical protein